MAGVIVEKDELRSFLCKLEEKQKLSVRGLGRLQRVKTLAGSLQIRLLTKVWLVEKVLPGRVQHI